MKKKNLLFISFVFLGLANNLYTQNVYKSEILYDRMQNAFAMGLNDQALSMSLDLITLPENEAYRERTIFVLGNHFLNQAFLTDLKESIKRAVYYFRLYQISYPEGEFTEDVHQYLNYIKNSHPNVLFELAYKEYSNPQVNIVKSILDNADLLVKINPLNPLSFFRDSRFNQNAEYIANKYYDEIIVNYPDFEIYAYVRKIYILLSDIYVQPLISSDLFRLETGTINKNDKEMEYQVIKNKAMLNLGYLCTNYPTHPITLDLNLVFAKLFMERKNGLISREIFNYLQFVLENDPDKNGIRYFLTKEFVSNNRFE